MSRERTFSTPESAIAHVKIDGMVQLLAIISAVTLWCLAALVLAILYIYKIVGIPQLSQFFQALTLVGLAPIAAAGLSYRLFLWLYATFLTSYARKHFQS
jgi:hypothetical protein